MSNPLGTRHYFSKMAALCQIPIGTRHYFCYLHPYFLSLTLCAISNMQLYRPPPLQPQISPYNPTTPHPHPYLTKHVNHVFMFISYKAISSPLVAAVASAAAVGVASAAAVVPLAGADVEVMVGATVVIRTTSDLTHFRLRNMNFLKYCFFRIA